MKKWFLILGIAVAVAPAHAQSFGGYTEGLTNLLTAKRSSDPRLMRENFTPADERGIPRPGIGDLHGGDGTPVQRHEMRDHASSESSGLLLHSGFISETMLTQSSTNFSHGAPPVHSSAPDQWRGTYFGMAIRLAPGTYSGTFALLKELGQFGIAGLPDLAFRQSPDYGHAFHYDNFVPPADSGEYAELRGTFPIALRLDPDTYWIALAPLGKSDQSGTANIASLIFGQPVNRGKAFRDDKTDPKEDFVPLGESGSAMRFGASPVKQVVPEPLLPYLLVLGLAGFLGLRRRSK